MTWTAEEARRAARKYEDARPVFERRNREFEARQLGVMIERWKRLM
jgi:hypothetical protein